MNRRRRLCIALGIASFCVPLPAISQQGRKPRRILHLSSGSVDTNVGWVAAFRRGMAELQWVEGRDYTFESRYVEGSRKTYAEVAAELVAARPDLLLAGGDAGTRMLAQKTKTIPIVVAIATDPVASGFAASLQRPGGNVTGLTSLARNLSAKRLELLKEAFPRIAHVAVLFDVSGQEQVKDLEEAASRLKLRLTPMELRDAADIEPAFKRRAALGVHAYVVTQGPVMTRHRGMVVEQVARSRVPSIHAQSDFIEGSGLMSYGPVYEDNFRRAAAYVDKIFKGAKPGDLPIQQPTQFELVVNLKTAKAMGLTFPQSILLRADRVIE